MQQVIVLIRSLDRGGAERQAAITCLELARRGYQIGLILFYDGGAFKRIIDHQAIQTWVIRKKGKWDVVTFSIKLLKVVRKSKTEVVIAYLGAAQVFSALLKMVFPELRVIWNIRSSNIDISKYNWTWKAERKLLKLLVKKADKIICNSHAAKSYLVNSGYKANSLVVIQNGIDISHFQPSRGAGREFRRAWKSDRTRIVGFVARLDSMKGHEVFLKAVVNFVGRRRDTMFVCVGPDKGGKLGALQLTAQRLGVSEHLIWAGECEDMVSVYNALDVNTLCSSFGEGFPNAVAEAMACGVPCVVTDVGDCAYLVGDTGIVVPPNNPVALAQAWEKMLSLDLEELGRRARERIVKNFSVERMVDNTVKVFEEVLGRPLERRPAASSRVEVG